ncbi:MAG: tRNA-binding protein [Cyclobacteriaceae bacterium]
MSTISWDDFAKVDMRVGTILRVEAFPEAHRPAYKLFIDFGPEIGQRKTSAQITKIYQADALVGRQVIAVVNFPPKQIANFMSECLVIGVLSDQGVVLLQPDQAVGNGKKIG